jgi:probable rRNA maturation factor
LSIRFYYDGVKYRLRESKRIKELLVEVIRENLKTPGDLKFIISDNESVLEINRKFLNHDYYTDVIAFDYSDKKRVNGEVYISIDTVRENSINYKVSLRNELLRVIIHATLHLCGFNDKDEGQRNIMRNEENKWLERYGRGGK